MTGRGDFDYVNAFLREDRAVFAGVIELQNKLWIEHSGGALGTGISAFPSLHVGAAMLPLLWLVDRFGWRGLIGAVFPLMIQYGSVVTGFHYAVDGYASALIACLTRASLLQVEHDQDVVLDFSLPEDAAAALQVRLAEAGQGRIAWLAAPEEAE